MGKTIYDICSFTLLYVGDDSESRATLGKMLVCTYPNLKVVPAVNGVDAHIKIEEHRPEILIIDLHMPLLDGIELIEETAEEGGRRKIIVISGCTDKETADKFIRSGASSYITKPVDFTLLCLSIDSIVRKMLGDRIRQEPYFSACVSFYLNNSVSSDMSRRRQLTD